MISGITPETLEANIREMTTRLLEMAGDLTYNRLSTNYQYILSEITDSQVSLTEHAQFLQLERTQPISKLLTHIMPEVLQHYADFYDINLVVHQASRQLTVIDIRYYAKSSLAAPYRQSVLARAPMLHAKVPMPHWVVDNKQKFDINWKIYAPVSRAKRLWLTRKWWLLAYLQRYVG